MQGLPLSPNKICAEWPCPCIWWCGSKELWYWKTLCFRRVTCHHGKKNIDLKKKHWSIFNIGGDEVVIMNPTLSSMIAWCPCGTGNLTAHAAFARVGNRNGTGHDMALPWTWSFLGVALSAMTGSVGLFFSWCWWPLMGDCCIPGWMWWCTYFLLWTWVVDWCTSKDLEQGWLLLWYGVDGVVAKSGVCVFSTSG